jgi:hypothetical protein
MGISGASIPSKSQDIVFRQIDDEAIFVPIRQRMSDLQSIYTTNPVGTRVWELIDGTRCVDDISETIRSEFEVAADMVREDVATFLEQLTEAECLEWSVG